MNALAFYNEHDPFAATWLRGLIAAGEIAPGVVDERSILDVRPTDLVGFTQCHFFAGIGGWSLALQLAGWPDDEPVWTGSCPCQPFSAAGRGGGMSDERHLWPAFYDLIRACRPPVVFGEQVASAAVIGGAKPLVGPAWLDIVFDDLEAAHYACGAADIPAAGVGAPHIRQRLWWVGVLADAERGQRGSGRFQRSGRPGSQVGEQEAPAEPAGDRVSRLLAHGLGPRLEGCDARPLGHECEAAERGGAADGLANSYGGNASAEGLQRGGKHGQQPQNGGARFWSDLEWLLCRDGKFRPTARAVEPGLQPVADGLWPSMVGGGLAYLHPLAPAKTTRNRVGTLRGAGNAIVPEAGAAFIRAVRGL